MTLRDKIKQKALTTAEIYTIKVLNETQREVMFWGKEFFSLSYFSPRFVVLFSMQRGSLHSKVFKNK